MNKSKKSITWLIVLTVIVLVTAAFGFAPRFTMGTRDFNSAVNLIELGFDLKPDGKPDYRTAEYVEYSISEYYVDYLGNYTNAEGKIVEDEDKVKMSEEDYNKALAQTVKAIKARLDLLVNKKSGEYTVTVLDNSKIRVACSDVALASGYITSSKTFFDVIGTRGNVSVKVIDEEPSETTDFSRYSDALEADQFTFLQVMQDSNGLGVAFMLENGGADALYKATAKASASKSLYICVLVDGVLQGTAMPLSTPVHRTTSYFTCSGMSDQNEAMLLGILSLSEGYDLAFVPQFNEIKSAGPETGANAALMALVVVLAVIVIAAVLFVVMYGKNGYAALLSFVECAVITVFLIAFIPFVVFGIESLIGVIAGLFVAIIAHLIVLRSVAAQNTDNLRDAVRDGHKSSLMLLLDVHFVALVAAILVGVLVTELAGFALAFAFALIASAVSSGIISRVTLLAAAAGKAN